MAFDPGDGSAPLLLPWQVTAVDIANDWAFIQAIDPMSLPTIDTTIEHTYPQTDTFVAFAGDCCRIGSTPENDHINNPDAPFRIETIVNVGSGNRSPVTNLPPIVFCPINTVCSFTIPGVDPDGDPLRFRFSTGTEASGFAGGFLQPGPPVTPNAASVDPSTGIYTWDTTEATVSSISPNTLYSTQVTIEDLDEAGNMKSKVAVDFLIQIGGQPGNPPTFTNAQCATT
jgi:hypothetical protein